MRKKLLSLFTLGLFAFSTMFGANNYGLPDNIQDGNILHCFDWKFSQVKAALPDIAAAGYGAVQLSPLQRKDVQSNWHWYDLYCPYDIAFQESSAIGKRQELIDLCAEAEKYGIKVIVDVVANHVNWTSGFYNKDWWEVGDRTRNGRSQSGSINYGNRQQITQNRLGDYFEVNSENGDVINRVVAYIKDLGSMGVKGIRWDAAKHIALPSESFGGPFWQEVTSAVPGMYHYGEILDDPSTSNPGLIKEYVKYMSVTDNRYSNRAGQNGGVPSDNGGAWANSQKIAPNKLVYWGESHDTYSNDEWSANVSQAVIDRAYAANACRDGVTCLYFVRPDQKGFGNITITKGSSTNYKSTPIAEVNKFRNAMTGKADFFTNNGNACCITRKDGGAVIVMKTSGQVSITNGGGYVPAGTYKDRVSGGTFNVSSSTISGTVGSSGIAVIYSDDFDVKKPAVNLTPGTQSFKTSTLTVTAELNDAATEGWYKIGTQTQVKLTKGTKKTFTIGADMAYGSKVTVTWSATGSEGTFTGSETYTKTDPNAGITVYVKASTAPNLYAWIPGTETSLNGDWPGTAMSQTTKVGNNTYYYKTFTDQESISIIFNNGKDGDDNKTADIENITKDTYYTYDGTSGYTVVDDPEKGGDDNSKVAIVPEGRFAIFVKASKAPNLYAWIPNTQTPLNGGWPGDTMTQTCSDGTNTYYYWVAPANVQSVNCIFNYNGDTDKTEDIENITKNTHFEYNGSSDAGKVLDQKPVPSGIQIHTSGVESVFDDPEVNDVNIGSSYGLIFISNANGENVAIYGIDGRMLFNSQVYGSQAIEVRKGIYVVNIDGKGKKVLVR